MSEVRAPGAWVVRVCCADGVVWDEFPDDVDHAFALIDKWGPDCDCNQPDKHYVECARPATWERAERSRD